MDWTDERIEKLTTAEVRQLQANAERLGNQAIMERCAGVLKKRRPVRRRAAKAAAGANPAR